MVYVYNNILILQYDIPKNYFFNTQLTFWFYCCIVM